MLNEILGFMSSGNIGGIPTIIVMAIPFIIGFFIGFLIKKFFKIIILVTLITFISSYLGFFALNLSSLKNIADVYGPEVIHYGTMLIGILPVGLGLLVGLVIGFLLG